MSQILIRNLSERAHQALKKQAAEHRHSLEGEIRAILEAATQDTDAFVLPKMVIPEKKEGKTLAELVSEGRR